MKAVFIRAIEAPIDDKAAVLRNAARGPSPARFEAEPSSFTAVPTSPYSYWVSDTVRETFLRYPPIEEHYTATRGAYTTDDFRYYRLTWEAPDGARANTREETAGRRAFVPLAKGGAFSAYYADIHLVVRWSDDGADPKAFLSAYRERKGWGTDWSACLNGYSEYFRPGLTWSRRSQVGLSLRVLPKGCIFGDKGPVAFVADDSSDSLLALLAVTNSSSFRALVALQMAFGSYEVGVIQRTPIPQLTLSDVLSLAKLARRSWFLKRQLDTCNETSVVFLLPTVVNSIDRRAIEQELESLQKRIDDTAFDLYGIIADDRAAIETPATSGPRDVVDANESDDGGDESDSEDSEDYAGTREAFVSWLVGVSFGRFDPRLAIGERPIPPAPEPFEPLPSRSPGMYPEGEEPAESPDILVDDEGHADDLAARAQAVAGRVQFDAPENLRGWLATEFFPLHIQMYSKSRRKAPIYWQIATPSVSYSVWLYIHAFSKDTLFRVQNDYVAPKLAHEERRLESLTSELRDGATATQRKQLATRETVVEELRAFLDEVKRVAPLWKPNLDDGVIINFAPLWRLVPQNKRWQKELKSTWDALCDGTYDWAHLAMHLWPERVVPKCATDRSLAIAHGLEDTLWVQDFDDRWRPRSAIEPTCEHLATHLHSPTLSTALASLRAFWKERFADAGREGADWWAELEAGTHDDAPIALAWWPDRVWEKAMKDPDLAKAHGLKVQAQLADADDRGVGGRKRRPPTTEKTPRFSEAERSLVSAFCGDLGTYPTWAGRWQAWDAGAFDHESWLAMRVRTRDVMRRVMDDRSTALAFGLERWFWVRTALGVRRLGEPEHELRAAVAERTSPAVKSALKSLLDAPVAGGAGRKAKKGKANA